MEKKRLTLKVGEFYLLSQEIDILNTEEISIKAKFRVNEIKRKIDEIIKPFTEVKDELIKKYGEEDNGTIGIKASVEINGINVKNPKVDEFIKELSPIENEEREIEFLPLKIDLFSDVKTKNPYTLIYNLMEE